MQYTPQKPDPLRDSIEPLIESLHFTLVEFVVSRHKGSVQIRAVVQRPGPAPLPMGVDDCSRVHHTILPRLELAFSGDAGERGRPDVYLEVSSPGIERLIKDGREFALYTGRSVRCYRKDTLAWTAGVVRSSDEAALTLEVDGEAVVLPYETIAKAKLAS